MILQALKEYYDRKAADPDGNIAPEGWERKEIPFICVLDSEGSFLGIEDTREGEGKNKTAKTFLVPKGVKRTSGIDANLLWDTAGYVFGLNVKGNSKRAALQKEAFIERLATELGDVAVVQTLILLLQQVQFERLEKEPYWEEICKQNHYVSFRMSDQRFLLCRHPEVVSKIDAAVTAPNKEYGRCLITGEKGRLQTVHTAIKGVKGTKSSGGNIVSFNLDSVESYGKKQGLNAPVSTNAEFAYTTAANTLLARNSKQRLLVGDATTIFWSEKRSSFESDFASFFDEPDQDNPNVGTQKVRALFDAVNTGAYKEDTGDMRFFILGLSPNAGRISVRFWHTGTILEFATKICQHFEDFTIVKPPNEPEHYSLWRTLVNISTQDKSDNIPPNLAGDFMRAILNGSQYPSTLLQAVVRRIRSDSDYRVKPVRAALIKAYLNRFQRFYPNSKQREVSVELDRDQPSVGYQLGRLFAVLEKIQEEASPGIKATIRERYYGAACSTPITVFPILLRLKNHHLAKLENKGRVVNFERLLSEIMERLLDFPAHLGLHEQGRFAIGYYHQRQSFFTQKETNSAEE